MSYTNYDWLLDNLIEDDDAKSFSQRMRDDGRAIVRVADIEALVALAKAYGLDPEVEAQWDDDDKSDALLAMANWRKDRRDWVDEP